MKKNTSSASPPKHSKADEILAVAQTMIQTRGYNGFSFREIAAEVGVKSASIHYHFPTKGDLAQAVAAKYRNAFGEALEEVEVSENAALPRLRRYAGLFRKTLVENDRVCLCGMLASEAESLPNHVKEEAEGFFLDQQKWLTRILEEGMKKQELSPAILPARFAKTFLSALEGGMLVARSTNRKEDLDLVAEELLSLLKT